MKKAFQKSEVYRENSKLYRIKSGYTLRTFLDECLAIPVELSGESESKVAILNPVAQFLWSRLEKDCTFHDLLMAVTEEFDVTVETAAEDIGEFLGQLKSYKLLRESEKEERI